MIGKTDKNPQLNVFRTPLVSVINMKHELVELAQRIDWKSIEKDFAPYYSDMGRPAVAVRKMVGCMLLKQMFGLSDEAFVDRWVEMFIGNTSAARPIFNLRNHLIPASSYTSASVLGLTEGKLLSSVSVYLRRKK